MAVSERRINQLAGLLKWETTDRTVGPPDDRARYVGAGTVVDGCHYGAEFELFVPNTPADLVERAKRRTAERLIEEGIV